MRILAGTLLVLEHGAYSDFTYVGPFRVVRTFDQMAVRDRYAHERKSLSPSGFIAWLATEGYIEDIPGSVTWDLGGYEFDPDIPK